MQKKNGFRNSVKMLHPQLKRMKTRNIVKYKIATTHAACS